MKLAEAFNEKVVKVRSLTSGEVAIFYPRRDPVLGRDRLLREVIPPFAERDLLAAGLTVAELMRSPNFARLIQQPGAALMLLR